MAVFEKKIVREVFELENNYNTLISAQKSSQHIFVTKLMYCTFF